MRTDVIASPGHLSYTTAVQSSHLKKCKHPGESNPFVYKYRLRPGIFTTRCCFLPSLLNAIPNVTHRKLKLLIDLTREDQEPTIAASIIVTSKSR